MTESVNKKCFHDTLEVMKAPVIHGIGLDRVNDAAALVAKILIYIVVVKDGVDD